MLLREWVCKEIILQSGDGFTGLRTTGEPLGASLSRGPGVHDLFVELVASGHTWDHDVTAVSGVLRGGQHYLYGFFHNLV